MAQSDRPPVWRMVREAMEALGGKTTNVDVRDWILRKYPGTNKNTIQCQIIVCTVNHPSRVYYQCNKPRKASGPYDFLFRPGPGKIQTHDPTRDGEWEIFETDDGRLAVRLTGSGAEPDDKEGESTLGSAFAAEAHLRDYLAQHLDQIDPGLELFVDDDGANGVEYATPVGRIDILAVDRNGCFVVVELKVSRGPDAVAGQVLRYKNWVKKHLGDGRSVRGLIVAQHVSEKVLYAIASDPDVSAIEYQLSLVFRPIGKISNKVAQSLT